MTSDEIGQIIGRSGHNVRLYAWKKRISLLAYGQNHWGSKYPNIIVEACRELYEQGHTAPAIAAEYGLPLNTVRAWCYWKKRLKV